MTVQPMPPQTDNAKSEQADSAQEKDRRIYAEWVTKYDTLNDDVRAKIRSHIARLKNRPLISVVMPVYNPNPKHFDETIRSVTAQLYPHWELCIADDASTDPEIRQIIDRYVKQDSRIKVVYRKWKGGISRATNSTLGIARGEFVAFLDHDDLLSEHALYWIVAELEAHPQTDILYSDSNAIDDANRRYDPCFKSDFNVEQFLGYNFIRHLCVCRRALVEALGGMRVGYEGSHAYELILKVLRMSAPDRVRHIAVMLYYWRPSSKPTVYYTRNIDLWDAAFRAAVRGFLVGSVFTADNVAAFKKNHDRSAAAARLATREFLARNGIKADVMPALVAPNWRRIRYHLPKPAPKVSVIIPTKNQAQLLQACVRGVLHGTDYPLLDVTIVDHESDDIQTKALLRDLAEDPRVRVLQYSGPFNFSAINNFAVDNTDGDVLTFLNNDVEIMHPDWLGEMVSHVMRPKVGAVGAKLYYPNQKIQHIGIITGLWGIAGHLFSGMPHDSTGPNGEAVLARELSAVTGACMVVRRSTFAETGGFDAVNLAVVFNDVDLCLRLRERGYKIVFTPFAELIHHESASRSSDFAPENQERFQRELEFMKARWKGILEHDPYYNPNFSLKTVTLDLAEPPRVRYPWNG